jgi:hypothetical protein
LPVQPTTWQAVNNSYYYVLWADVIFFSNSAALRLNLAKRLTGLPQAMQISFLLSELVEDTTLETSTADNSRTPDQIADQLNNDNLFVQEIIEQYGATWVLVMYHGSPGRLLQFILPHEEHPRI